MGYEAPEDLAAPEHDPVADEQDLLTVQEAAARLYDQLGVARAQLTEAESAVASSARVAALRQRVDVLEMGMQRYDVLRRERAARG